MEGDEPPPTAESLMRSRYTAFAVGDTAYLLRSWHPSSRPEQFELDSSLRWYRLDILSTTAGGPLDTEGTVEFHAYFKHDGGAGSQREFSHFVRAGGRWLYLDGVVAS
ncbi:YchJ family metal-binding protein [Paenarthrobacter sp. PH39-S1]|uniref:YchJ family protein n=1 Tax=Paenarthrobacter sp. PH39-S1 TaxID=3046204 RepID=UPI0024BB3746|nr:YchJ family metal-binding protein [Paenarthrobacter sp. PH39-S1]MDJ0355411.1 YchJ family metal-binding protein [Paenarthrobacter sp. PH39-S1]